MNLWLREELDLDKTSRKAGSKAICNRFVTLSASLVLVAAAVQEEEGESVSDIE
jgi:hypothetical protein